jgi:hypothetical protein
MGRGAQQQTLQLTDQQLANTNALNQQFLNQQQQTGNTLNSQYQSILANPGLSSADQAAVTGQSQGALASAFDSLQQSAQNRVAATNNSAGFSDLTDELARQKGIAVGNQAAQNQFNFDNTAFNRQMAALQGLSRHPIATAQHRRQLLAQHRFLPLAGFFRRRNPRRTSRRHFVKRFGSTGTPACAAAQPASQITRIGTRARRA